MAKAFGFQVAPAAEPKDRSRISTLDFLLMMVGSMLAVYSAGESVAQPEVGWYFVRLVFFGSIFSFLVRQLSAKTQFIKIDGLLYTAVAIYATFNVTTLNRFLPGEPFPRELQAAAYLSWMLVLGSFVSWRDGTLLFQAVPAMALFGLVGCYDTYRDVIFAFFGFLLCLSTLFSRANGRDMLRLVIDSGFAGRAEARNVDKEAIRQDQALYERVRQGPWRWIAGPEWALLTAFVVILLSLLGAPVVQSTVQAATGGLKISMPSPTPRRNTANAPTDQDLQMVGRGPNTTLSARALYEIEMNPTMPYLRLQVFGGWSGLGWRRGSAEVAADVKGWMKKPVRMQFSIRRLVDTTVIPTPGEVLGWNDPVAVDQFRDGTFRIVTNDTRTYAGVSVIPNQEVPATSAVTTPEFDWARDVNSINNRVSEMAMEAIQGAESDVDKANQIREYISRRARYNLKAPATPAGDDPVRFFLDESREGYCDVFASAMVQMARSVGLPARYVQGYLAESVNRDSAGRTVILERDYHAWAEVLIEGRGWMIFDATDGAIPVDGAERGSELSNNAWAPGGLNRRILDATIVTVAVFLVGAFGYIQWQNRRHITRRTEVERIYLSFQKSIVQASGQRRRPSVTITEFIEAAVPADSQDAARELGRKFESVLYADGEPSAETVATLKLATADWQKLIKNRKPTG